MKMRVLIVKKIGLRPFVEEQTDAIKRYFDIDFLYHNIQGKGISAYILDVPKLIRDIKQLKPHIIHVHYGMSGFYVCVLLRLLLLKKIPLVITYHGSDINNSFVRRLSQKAITMAGYNIFVSPKLAEKVHVRDNSQVIPCGINLEDWPEINKSEARRMMGLDEKKKIVLFSSNYRTPVKNSSLAIESVKRAQELLHEEVQLIELTKYTRAQVNLMMHAADVCIMTSFSEGSPQFIKEAMACSCPIVTTRVGDTEFVIGNTEGCFFTDYSPHDCANQIKKALQYANDHNRTKGRKRIEEIGYSNEIVAHKIIQIYNRLMLKE